MIVAPHRIDPPLVMFSVLPLALFTFKLVKLAHLYTSRMGANIRQTLAAAVAGLALSHTIGVAVDQGLLHAQRTVPVRTPKVKQPHAPLRRLLRAARQETALLVRCSLRRTSLTHQIRSRRSWCSASQKSSKGRTFRCGWRCC